MATWDSKKAIAQISGVHKKHNMAPRRLDVMRMESTRNHRHSGKPTYLERKHKDWLKGVGYDTEVSE